MWNFKKNHITSQNHKTPTLKKALILGRPQAGRDLRSMQIAEAYTLRQILSLDSNKFGL